MFFFLIFIGRMYMNGLIMRPKRLHTCIFTGKTRERRWFGKFSPFVSFRWAWIVFSSRASLFYLFLRLDVQ